MTPLIPDDFWPYQVAHDIGTTEIRIVGSRRKAGSTVAASRRVVTKDVSDLTPTRRQRLAAVKNALVAQSTEEGYEVQRLVLNLDAHPTQDVFVVEGYYEFADGSKSGTRIKQYRLIPLSPEEIEQQNDPEEPETFLEVADLTEAQREHILDIMDNLRQLAREAEGF